MNELKIYKSSKHYSEWHGLSTWEVECINESGRMTFSLTPKDILNHARDFKKLGYNVVFIA